MKRQITQGFNKEKLAFLAIGCVTAAALFHFMTSEPMSLKAGNPISAVQVPIALDAANVQRVALSFGDRNPFAPVPDVVDTNVVAKTVKIDDIIISDIHQPIDPDWPPFDIKAKVKFMGVAIADGMSYGLLKPKDGGDPIRVKVGDVIDMYKCRVISIQKQSITVADSHNRAVILKDRETLDLND